MLFFQGKLLPKLEFEALEALKELDEPYLRYEEIENKVSICLSPGIDHIKYAGWPVQRRGLFLGFTHLL